MYKYKVTENIKFCNDRKRLLIYCYLWIIDDCIRNCCNGYGLPVKCLREKLQTKSTSMGNGSHVNVGVVMSLMCHKYQSILDNCISKCTEDDDGK